MTNSTVRFLFKNNIVAIENIDPNLTVLQYLREIQFNTGTKEGCASGDCGACTVVLAELDADNVGQLHYNSINSCITFVGSLHGKQLITVEDLKEKTKLHHAQQTIVDNHASQCGFCTPGMVMSAIDLLQTKKNPSDSEIREWLEGNICRCTGYQNIVAAVKEAAGKI